MVSLPAKWIKQNNLSKGSDIEIEEVDANLIISAKPQEIKSETSIKIESNVESYIRTLITNSYRSGFDRIKINFENPTQFKILNNVIKTRLIGFEVINKEKNYCIVENITEPSSDQFDSILRKIFFNITELFEITKKILRDKNINDEDFEEIEERIQKYDNFCRRVITKKKLFNKKSEFIWTFLSLIIHGQREIYHINKLLNKNFNVSIKTVEFLEEAEEFYEIIMQAYLNKNVSLISKIHSKEKELLYKRGYLLLEQTKGKEIIIIYHIMISIREFYQANSPLTVLIT